MVGVVEFLPVLRAADVRAGALVDSDDAGAGGGVEGGSPGIVALHHGEQTSGFGPDQVVGLGCQRMLRVEAGRSTQT